MRFSPKTLLMIGLVLILGVVNSKISFHERDLKEGRRLVLELLPRDPRSLMQGDYMVLNYQLANQIPTNLGSKFVYLEPGPHSLATIARYEPSEGAIKLKYRVHDGRVRFDIESYFFQEGQASRYQRARYVELSVTPDGVPKILHLLDEKFQVI